MSIGTPKPKATPAQDAALEDVRTMMAEGWKGVEQMSAFRTMVFRDELISSATVRGLDASDPRNVVLSRAHKELTGIYAAKKKAEAMRSLDEGKRRELPHKAAEAAMRFLEIVEQASDTELPGVTEPETFDFDLPGTVEECDSLLRRLRSRRSTDAGPTLAVKAKADAMARMAKVKGAARLATQMKAIADASSKEFESLGSAIERLEARRAELAEAERARAERMADLPGTLEAMSARLSKLEDR